MDKIVLLALLVSGVVSDVPSRQDASGNGTLCTFGFAFPTYAATDVDVYIDGVLQVSGYTITLNANQDASPGGTCLFATAPANGTVVRLERTQALSQTVILSPYSPFPAKTVERGLDKTTTAVQDVKRRADDGYTLAQQAVSDAAVATSIANQAWNRANVVGEDADAAMARANAAYDLADSANTTALQALYAGNQGVANAATAQATANSAYILAGGADTKAVTALGDAATAQGTANTALINAATAQGVADTALGNAATAQGRADSAYSLADNAHGDATTALGNAATAQNTANTAVSNAATAQGRADSAYSLADHAHGRADDAYTYAGVAHGEAEAAAETAGTALASAEDANEGVLALTNQSTPGTWSPTLAYVDVAGNPHTYLGTQSAWVGRYTRSGPDSGASIHAEFCLTLSSVGSAYEHGWIFVHIPFPASATSWWSAGTMDLIYYPPTVTGWRLAAQLVGLSAGEFIVGQKADGSEQASYLAWILKANGEPLLVDEIVPGSYCGYIDYIMEIPEVG